METMVRDALRPEPELGSVIWLEPGVLFCRSPEVHADEVVYAYYRAMHDALDARPGPYVFISDTRHIQRMPGQHTRRLHAELGAELKRTHPKRCVYSLTIVDGTMMRAIVMTVLWFIGETSATHQVVGTKEEALRIAREKLGA